jgi:hypothetical protein
MSEAKQSVNHHTNSGEHLSPNNSNSSEASNASQPQQGSVSHLPSQQKATVNTPQHQRRIIAEDPEWNLAPVDKLSDMCVRVLVANFESKETLIVLIFF